MAGIWYSYCLSLSIVKTLLLKLFPQLSRSIIISREEDEIAAQKAVDEVGG